MRVLSGWGLQDSAAVSQAAGETVLLQIMFLQAARDAGIDVRPAEQRWRQRVQAEYMIRELRREEAVKKAEVNQAEARDFYEEYPDIFRQPQGFFFFCPKGISSGDSDFPIPPNHSRQLKFPN